MAGNRLNEPALALALAGTLALVACDKNPVANGNGPEPTEPVNLTVVGQGVVNSRFTAEVAVRGTFAYTTTWSRRVEAGNAVFVWNVAGAPVLEDTVIVEDAATLGDIQISDAGELIVVAKEGPPGYILLFDRSRPDSIFEISRFLSGDTERGVHTVKLGRIAGRQYAFLSVNRGQSTSSKLVIVDITDPARPVQVLAKPMDQPGVNDFLHDTFVRDGILFTALWESGLSIWDIGGGGLDGTVANPVLISNIITVEGNVHNAWWFHNPNTGEKKYVFVGEENAPFAVGSTSAGDIHVVDISDIENPREVAFYSVPGAGAHNFSMDEQSEILYAAFYNGGVRALDVSGDLSVCPGSARSSDNRCDLRLAGREVGIALATGMPSVSIWGVAVSGNRLYASDMLSGLYVLDISGLQR